MSYTPPSYLSGINELDDIDSTDLDCLIYGAERLYAVSERDKRIEIYLQVSSLLSMLMNVIFTSSASSVKTRNPSRN